MHLALICPEMTGHLNPMTTLGTALLRRGHRVSLVGSPEVRQRVEAAGLEFLAVGVPEHRSGSHQAGRAKLATLHGYSAMRWTGKLLSQEAAITLRDAPHVLRTAGVDGVVADQVSPAGVSVAQALALPLGVVCNALALHQEPSLPPPVTPWSFRSGAISRMRNRLGNQLLTSAARSIATVIDEFRASHGLPKWRMTADQDVGLVQVAQQPAFLDFPREQLPEHFHYTGPWHQQGRDGPASFPWRRLDGRPLIYASLGTLQNQLTDVFTAIVRACGQLDLQLVLSLGRRDAQWLGPQPGGTIIVPYAPQLDLLRHATAVITHAGLNTALETLACGRPMVAIPITNDQPGVAKRLEWLGVAKRLRLSAAKNPEHVKSALETVLHEPRFAREAQRNKRRLERCPTVNDAAALVEHALHSGQRLTRREAVRLSLATQTCDNSSSATSDGKPRSKRRRVVQKGYEPRRLPTMYSAWSRC